MKNLLPLFLILFSFSVYGQSQKNLETVLEEFRMALLKPEEPTLLRLTSKDLTYGHSSGLVENQSQFIDALKNGPASFESFNVSDQTISFSDNIAIVRQNMTGDLKNGDTITKLNLGILYVWKREKVGWQLIARQAFKR